MTCYNRIFIVLICFTLLFHFATFTTIGQSAEELKARLEQRDTELKEKQKTIDQLTNVLKQMERSIDDSTKAITAPLADETLLQEIRRLKSERDDANKQSTNRVEDSNSVHSLAAVADVRSLAVLGFTFLILTLETLVILKSKKGWNIASTRIYGVTLIVTSSLYLITAGYTETQIAPVVGLLGTIAGFLLGKSETGKQDSDAGSTTV